MKGESEQTTKDSGWLGSCVCLLFVKGRETRKGRGTRVARGALEIFRGADEVKGERRKDLAGILGHLSKRLCSYFSHLLSINLDRRRSKKSLQIVEGACWREIAFMLYDQ